MESTVLFTPRLYVAAADKSITPAKTVFPCDTLRRTSAKGSAASRSSVSVERVGQRGLPGAREANNMGYRRRHLYLYLFLIVCECFAELIWGHPRVIVVDVLVA